MKSMAAIASVITLALISSFQSQDMATCLNGHTFAVCHHALNR